MHRKHHQQPATVVVALLLAGLLLWPAAALAQLGGLPLPLPSPTPTTASTVTGQATAAQVTLLGLLGTATSTSLATTGISAANTESDVAQDTGSLSILGAEALNAATYSYSDQVDSMASLGSLSLTVAGLSISADSVVAEASQVVGAAGSGSSYIDNLAVSGVPVTVTGDPNQTIPIPGGQLVLNEQTVSSTGGVVVNAVHVVVYGVADVVLASAAASIS